MSYKIPNQCPVCAGRLSVNKLVCGQCSTMIEGDFAPCRFCRLPADQLEFVEVFIKCRGNIKEVEKELNISYPTVRSRLDGVIEALGYKVEKEIKEDQQAEKERRQNIISALERGEITAREAAKQLRKSDD